MIQKRENGTLRSVTKLGKAALFAVAVVSLLSPAAQADPFAEGVEFYQKRNFSRAAGCFETVLVRSPEQTNAMYYAGLTYQQIPTSIVSPDKQFTVYFDDVAVGPEHLVGQTGDGLRQVFAGLNPERILVGAICGGVGRYAIARAVDYARQREVWGTPIGAHQGVAHPLAAVHMEVEAGRLATQLSARLCDEGHPGVGEAANVAKYLASEAALKALDQSIQTHGGNGLSQEYGLSDLWFVTRLMRTAPVSKEMVLNFVAQTSLGQPRSN